MTKSSRNSVSKRQIIALKVAVFCWVFVAICMPSSGQTLDSVNTESLRERLPFYECFNGSAAQHEVGTNWLIAVAIIESSLDPNAISTANAIGIMQIKWPQTANHLGIKEQEELFDPCSNIEAGARYLAEVREPYIDLAPALRDNMMLAAYRIGPNAVKNLEKLPTIVEEYIKKVRSEKNNLEEIEQTPENQCLLKELKSLTLTTHHPRARREKSITWIRDNHDECDPNAWKKISDNLPVWLGTAYGSKKLQDLLSSLLNR